MNKTTMGSLGLLLGALLSTSAVQASDCKSLPQASCQAESSCAWIKGYTRKDGREVAPYCRAVRQKQSALGVDQAAAVPPSKS